MKDTSSYFDCRFYFNDFKAPPKLDDAYQYKKSTFHNNKNYYYEKENYRTSYFKNKNESIHPVFKIPRSSSEEDFKKVYRRMILETHPDKVDGCQAEFIRVREAWEELCENGFIGHH